MKITIIEFVDEYSQYQFYRAYKSKTPKQAVLDYLEEIGDLEPEEIKALVKKVDDEEYEAEDRCRAYKVELE